MLLQTLATTIASLTLLSPIAPLIAPRPHTAPAPLAADTNRLDEAKARFDRLGVAFEPAGDENPDARFVARTPSYALALGDAGARYVCPEGAVTMRFGRPAQVSAEERLAGVRNYIVGDDPGRWRRDVPTFGRVRYTEVAPGVDLLFYGTNRAPEYDFIVAPGADPNGARFEIDGATSIGVDRDGALVLRTSSGEIRHEPPVAFQERGGGRIGVDARYRVDGCRVAFDVGAYDPSLPLVVDPVLAYATLYGGSADDRVNGAAVTPGGEVVIVGQTLSTNLPLAGSAQGNLPEMDGFVAKLNAAGTALVFATYVGGNATDNFNGVALDASGRIAIAGSSASNDYPTVDGYDNSPNGLDALLTVLTSSGGGPLYSTVIGGGNNDIGNAVAWDVHGNAYLAGETLDFSGVFSRNFPTKSPSSLPPFQDDYGGGRSDAFVCKFDPDQSGNTSLVYSTLIGGSEGEGVEAIVVDELERAYVCGYTESSNFPRQSARQNVYGGGTTDGFVTKFNADGTTVFYSTFFGGSAIDETLGIALDTSAGDNRAVVTGFTTSSNIPTQLPIQAAKNGPQDMVAFKLNDAGTQFVYSTYFGGPGNDAGQAVAVDAAGNAYLTGFSNSSYPLLAPIPVNGAIRTTGAFVTKLSAAGSLQLSTCVSSSGEAIGLDAAGNVYVAGTSSLSDFPATPGAFQSTNAGVNDGFVFKLDIVDDDTIGIFKPGTRQFQLRNTNTAGVADITATFGATGDKPLAGDWDGDGDTTIGVYTPSSGTFSFRNSNTSGPAEFSFVFGAPNLVPIAGDWNGDGVDTVGIYDPATGAYFLTNSSTGGNADFAFTFGPGGSGTIPLAGDWDGDGVDTIGFYVVSTRTFFLRNANAGGNADLQFVFGAVAATPVAGDWNGDGVDTVGVFARTTFLPNFTSTRFTLRNANSAGEADFTIAIGVAGDLPVAGNWDGN
jgi:hypothetical protein